VSATQVSAGAAPELHERRAELREIEAALAAAERDEGQLLLLSGPAGVGKTALLRAAIAAAAERGFLVLGARGGELEQSFPFGVVGQLFAPVVHDAEKNGSDEDLLAGDARLAELALSPAPGAPPRDADFALLNALYWLCANLCERSPVLLVVDDAHWADAASLRLLSFLARRRDGIALALAVAARTGEPGAGADPFAELGLEDRARRIEPGLLSAAAVSDVVRERLWEGASDELCRACHEATRGNALLVEQVIAGLRQSGKPLMEIVAGDIDGVAAEGISAGVMARIAPLGPEARALAEATAVLGTRAEPRHAAALAKLEPDRAEHIADGLRAAGVLAPGRGLDFVHPLIRTSIYDAIPVGQRGSAHAIAAKLLAAEDADPGAVAAHLLHAPRHGDADAVARLRAAATASLARGAADRAVVYLRRALEEPPTPDLRPMVMFALGAAEANANDPAAADTLERARRLATDPMLKRGISLSMGGVLIAAGQHDDLMDIIDEELRQLGDDDTELTAAFETFALATLLASPPDWPLSERAQRIRRAGIVDGLAPEIARMRLAVLARCELNFGGQAAMAVDLADRSLADGRLIREHLAVSAVPFAALGTLTWAGELQRSERYHDDAIALSREGHLTRALATSLTGRAVARRQMGKLDDAEADVTLALRLDAELPMSFTEPVSRAVLCEIRLDRGDLDAAREAITLDLQRYEGIVASFRFLRAARARLHLALGDPDEALRELSELGDRRVDELGTRAELAPHWPPLAVRALLASGERDEARRLAEKDVNMARAFGAPGITSAALVGLGLCEDDRDRAIVLLEEAVDQAQRSEVRVALLAALVELGAAKRRAGHRAAARDPLRAAIDLADRSGAAAFGDRARDEVRSTGARPRRQRLSGPASLTASERRVADLAVEGRTNRQIAQELFVTIKTVEMHLSNVYRKLDVGSRGELTAALSEG
jgi:DNA-binding CsgD family transcriptional regulator/tetratricopeptide (TPR) repeat protein